MSDITTRQMIGMYNQMASPTRFFSSMFSSPPANFHSSEEVEFDILRSEEDIAIAIQDLSTGYRFNSEDIYVNKSFRPPIFKEAIPLNASDLIKREPGQHPFTSGAPDFRANLVGRAFRGMTKVEQKIRRAMELQASQALQIGVVTLIDSNGNSVYVIDYKPKTAHFPTAGTSWASATATQKIADIDSLGTVVRTNGLTEANMLIFGVTAWRNFTEDTGVRLLFDTRRIDQGVVAPMRKTPAGGIFRGVVEIGNYHYEMWTYDGRYTHPQTGVSTPFMDPGKIIVRASQGRLDATFGMIPNIGKELGLSGMNMIPDLPSRLSNEDGGMDMFTNAWVTNDGEQLVAGVGSRPLMIPTAIDTFGCLDTQL